MGENARNAKNVEALLYVNMGDIARTARNVGALLCPVSSRTSRDSSGCARRGLYRYDRRGGLQSRGPVPGNTDLLLQSNRNIGG